MNKTTPVRLGAIYDLIVTLPFALPVVSSWNLESLKAAHEKFHFSGEFPIFLPGHELFVNLLGWIVTIWSLTRIFRPTAEKGWWDTLARGLFVFTFVISLFQGVTSLVWGFLALEVFWGIFQATGLLWGKDTANLQTTHVQTGNRANLV